MKRREFISLIGGAAAAWPLDVRAQPDERVRRIGILWRGDVAEGVVQALEGALREELAKRGWIEGRNVRFDLRYSADDPGRIRTHADELVGLGPDLIVASSSPVAQAVVQRTRTIPIVFVNVADPVAGGLLKNIAHPEGNATGITSTFLSMGGKWLELLKEAAPRTAQAALIFAAENVNVQFFDVINATAETLAMKAVRTPYRNAAELQSAVDAFAAQPNGALLMVPPPPSPADGELINRLAIKYRLPTIYSSKYYVARGGMMSYGAPIVESYRIAASYVDRILRGAKINELPVQFPTRLEMAINLKTAKAIGLTMPRTILGRADELIE
jgi:putative tryptophan/tyrosine transport system substrate-binding protein